MKNILNTLEKGLYKNTNHDYHWMIMQKKKPKKLALKKTKIKQNSYLVLDLMYSLFPILTPQIPIPLDCQLPFRNL